MTALGAKIAHAAAAVAARLRDRHAPRSAVTSHQDAVQECPKIRIESDELSGRDRRELAAGLAQLADLTRELGDPAAAARRLWGDQ